MPRRPRAGRRAFTLVELMISIALVVLLMMGVNLIFKMSSDTIGMGQTLTAITADHRSAQAVMEEDFRQLIPDSPVFIIHSSLADPKVPNTRQDLLRFFRRGMFSRQTGNVDTFIGDTQSTEAYVCYGFTWDPATNRRSAVLGRNAILLRDPINIGSDDKCYYMRRPVRDREIPNLTPLTYDTYAVDDGGRAIPLRIGHGSATFYSSRVDLAGITVDRFREIVRERRTRVTTDHNANPLAPDTIALDDNWWAPLISPDKTRPLAASFFLCNPRIRKDVEDWRQMAEQVALAAPYFVGNVSEFRVEFAGDFISQDENTGRVTRDSADGRIDFMFVNGVRKVRWYGLPRETSGDNRITWADDVVPVRDVIAVANLNPAPNPLERPFERFFPTSAPRPDYTGADLKDPYICIWVNDAPAMLRVAFKIEDPTQRLKDGQWCEFVLGPR